jgi:hypothetical protein
MLEPFDFIIDLILLRWLLDDEDRSKVWTILAVLLLIVVTVVVVGFVFKWW